MKLASKQSPGERLATFLKEHRSLLGTAGFDVEYYISQVEQGHALRAVRELWQRAEAEDLHLPMGYWRFIDRLRQELEKHEP